MNLYIGFNALEVLSLSIGVISQFALPTLSYNTHILKRKTNHFQHIKVKIGVVVLYIQKQKFINSLVNNVKDNTRHN